MKININSYLPSSKLVAMAVRFQKCDGTIWDTLLNWFPRLLQDCKPLVFRHVLNLKVQEFLASHQKMSWRNIWLGHLQISPLPEVQWAVKRRVKGCKHSQVDEKESIEIDVGCATCWSQQQVLQAPKRSIWYRFFLKIKQYMGVEPHIYLSAFGTLGIFLTTNFILANSNHSCFVRFFFPWK